MRTPCRWVAASLPGAALADQGQIRGIRYDVCFILRSWRSRASGLVKRAGDGGGSGLDLVRGVIAAKPKADALAAHVGDDVGAREPVVQRLRAGELEGEEMTARCAGRD